jgi:Ribosomal prokaryotic L21 protein
MSRAWACVCVLQCRKQCRLVVSAACCFGDTGPNPKSAHHAPHPPWCLQIIVFKFKPKKHYRRKTGHRQHLTRFLVTDIVLGAPPLPVSDDGAATEQAG